MTLIKNRVIVCSPGMEYFRISELDKHNITSKSYPEEALSQHLSLKDTLSESGGDNFVTGNIISLGNHEVIAEKTNATAIDILKQKGYRIHSLGLSEFIKGTSGPSCLILPV